MGNGRIIKYAARLFLAVIVGLFLLGSLPTPVQANGYPVDLEVGGGEVGTSWGVSNIMPGDSDTEAVILHNAGSEDGFVTIWIDNIVSGEGENPESETGDKSPSGPGELDNYLQFSLSADPSDRLSTGLSLPGTIYTFPGTASASDIIVSPLNVGAGEDVTLHWEWELPLETGNDAQGDTLSFHINYLLEGFPSPPPPPPVTPSGGGGPAGPCYFRVDMLTEITKLRISCCGNSVLKDYVPTDPDEVHFLVVDAGTVVFCGEYPGCGDYPEIIVMSVAEDPPSPPEGMTIVGPAAYHIIGYWDRHRNEICTDVTFDPPLTLILSHGELGDAFSPVVAYYDEEEGCWVPLAFDTGRVAEYGMLAVLMDHLSLFAVLAELPPPPAPPPAAPAPPPPPLPPPPAHFVASDLTIVPSWEKMEWGALTFAVSRGESVTVTTNVGNDGGQEGSYVANLKINGQTRDTKEITLSPGQSAGIAFSILDNEPGHYAVEIGGLSGEFQTSVWVNWWLIAGLTAAFILLVWVAWYYGYYRKRHLK